MYAVIGSGAGQQKVAEGQHVRVDVLDAAEGDEVTLPAKMLVDGDTVLAVIRGSAINNDGRAKVGYLAPSVPGQAQVVTEALAVAGVDARDVTYVEAHGTGTLIGDPIEIAGLTQAFRLTTDDTQFCGIGSLKSNIGHTGEAAGVGLADGAPDLLGPVAIDDDLVHDVIVLGLEQLLLALLLEGARGGGCLGAGEVRAGL